MDFNWNEWLNLALRWLHVFARILWVGQTFFFTWLDARFSQEEKVWMVHSGGFYTVVKQKTLAVPPGEGDPSLFAWVASWSPSSAAALLGALGLGLFLAWKEATETKKRYARWGTTPRIPAE